MPSARQSEPDEVVEAFTGDTLEEAMAAAVAALGPDLVVRRARKVRSGLSGLMGKERYEVLALPDPNAPEDPAAAVESAFDLLLGQADALDSSPYPPAAALPAALPTAPAPAAPSLPPPPAAARRRPPTGVPAAAAGIAGTTRPRSPLAASAPHPGLDLVDHEEPPRRTARRGDGPRSRTPRVLRRAPEREQLEAAPEPPRDEAAFDPASFDPASFDPASFDPAGPDAARPDAARPDAARPDAARPEAARAAAPEPAAAPPPPADVPPAPGPVAVAPPVEAAPPPVEEDEPVDDEPAPPPARGRGRRAPARRGGWSAAALQRLGVPAAVMEHLEPPRPADDLAWVGALARAIAAVVPDPAEPSEAHPVVLSGHGLAGALAVLEAGTQGATPGTISYGGRTAPATATELALALRHHLGGS